MKGDIKKHYLYKYNKYVFNKKWEKYEVFQNLSQEEVDETCAEVARKTKRRKEKNETIRESIDSIRNFCKYSEKIEFDKNIILLILTIVIFCKIFCWDFTLLLSIFF